MKIRIKSNSIRYRLTRSDVAFLSEKRYIEDKVNFCEKALIYAIRLVSEEELAAHFIDSTITLLMPENMIDELANTDKVGFDMDINDLQILIEKDFTCLDNVTEDQSDNYPNPLAEHVI